jgi:hypothetical protein
VKKHRRARHWPPIDTRIHHVQQSKTAVMCHQASAAHLVPTSSPSLSPDCSSSTSGKLGRLRIHRIDGRRSRQRSPTAEQERAAWLTTFFYGHDDVPGLEQLGPRP